MTRSQLIAVLLGAALVVVGVGLVWKGVVPGLPPVQKQVAISGTPAAPATATSGMAAEKAASATSSATVPTNEETAAAPSTASAKPQQEASLPPATSAVPATEPGSPPAPTVPAFDTVRVEPTGDTVVAGHGAAGAKIALTAGDKTLAEVQADSAGNFVMVPPALPPGDYVLGLRSTGPDGAAVDSHQNVTVSVPAKGQKNVVVALAEPGKPSVILTDPTAKGAATEQPSSASSSAGAQSTAQPEVAFKTAEVDNGGFYTSGTASPGAHLRIYLNGSALADVTASTEGRWSLTIGKGMAPGHFAVRADAIDAEGNVLARAEVPFDVPVAVAEAKPAPAMTKPASTMAKPAPSMAAAPAKAALATIPAPATPKPAASTPASPAPKSMAPAPAVPLAPESAAAAPGPTSGAAEQEGSKEPRAGGGKESVATAAPLPTANANNAVVPEIDTTKVVPGDSLWRISRKIFGQGIRYTLIYEANASQIRDPKLIYPGQIFVLPHAATN